MCLFPPYEHLSTWASIDVAVSSICSFSSVSFSTLKHWPVLTNVQLLQNISRHVRAERTEYREYAGLQKPGYVYTRHTCCTEVEILHHVHLTAFLSIHIKAKVYFGLKVFPLALQTLKTRRFSHMKKWHYITSQPIASGPLLSSAHQPVGKMSSDKDSSPVNRTGLLALFHVSIRKHTVYQPVLLSNVLSNKLSLPQTPHEVVAILRRMAAIITSCPVRPLRWTLRQGSS